LTRIPRLEPFGKRRKEFGGTERRKAEQAGASESTGTNSNALKALRKLAQQRCLVCKGEVWIFEQVVHQDDQLPHDGCEGDFGGFACGDQPRQKT
jgi:hypothetical protein